MSHFPTYPEEYTLSPSVRTSLTLGLYGWLMTLSHKYPDLSRSEIAALATDRLLEAWFVVPWPTERLGYTALLVALLWLFGGRIARTVT